MWMKRLPVSHVGSIFKMFWGLKTYNYECCFSDVFELKTKRWDLIERQSESSSVVVFLLVYENRHETGNLIIPVVSEC